MLSNFRTYQMALQFHRACVAQPKVPRYLRDQLNRASSSVALNLAEGSGKPSTRDQAKFYSIAMGSLRESQAVLEIVGKDAEQLVRSSGKLGGSLFKLIEITQKRV
jgi:four helix bundle protein